MTRALVVCSLLVVASGFSRSLQADAKQGCVDAHTAAQELRQAGKLRAARVELATCAQAACPTVARDDCARWSAEIDAALASVDIDVRDDHGRTIDAARVTVDGAELPRALADGSVTLDPGAHTFRAEAAGAPPSERIEVLRTGERHHGVAFVLALPATVAPAAPSRTLSPLVLVLGGVSVVALGGFGYFALAGKSGEADLRACKPSCQQSDVDDVRTKYLLANVFAGVSVVALGAAIVLAARGAGTPSQPTVSFDLSAEPSGARGWLRGRFLARVGAASA